MGDLRCPHCGGGLSLVAGGPVGGGVQDLKALSVAYCTEQRVTGVWSEQWAAIAPRQIEAFVAAGHPLDRRGVAAWRQELLESESRSATTVNLYLSTLSGFCNWLRNRGEIESNPVQGQAVKGAQKQTAQDARLAFTAVEVGAFLEFADAFAPTPGHRALVWCMAFTGARNEEIGQLRANDVRSIDSFAVFDLATVEEGQRRKTAASRRLVPVHDRLHDMIDIVKRDCLDGEANLWGFTNTRKGGGGRYSYTPSRWANEVALRTLKRQGKVRDDNRLTLYSLRHSVITQLKHKGIPEVQIAELVGHTNSSMTTGRYGKRYPVAQLAEVVEKIEWPI